MFRGPRNSLQTTEWLCKINIAHTETKRGEMLFYFFKKTNECGLIVSITAFFSYVWFFKIKNGGNNISSNSKRPSPVCWDIFRVKTQRYNCNQRRTECSGPVSFKNTLFKKTRENGGDNYVPVSLIHILGSLGRWKEKETSQAWIGIRTGRTVWPI